MDFFLTIVANALGNIIADVVHSWVTPRSNGEEKSAQKPGSRAQNQKEKNVGISNQQTSNPKGSNIDLYA